MSAWTRFKYLKTQLPPDLRLKNANTGGSEKGKVSNQQSKPNADETKNERLEMTEQMRKLREKERKEEAASLGMTVEELEKEEKENNNETDNKNNKDSKEAKRAKRELNKKIDKLMKEKYSAALLCPNCKNGGSPLNDPKGGRTVCTGCGLVLEVGFISDQSEWRNFADGDKSGPDPNRVGSAGHYLLNDIDDLSTKIGDGSSLGNLQQSTANSAVSQKLLYAIRTFERNGRDLGLTKDTQNCAGEIFKDLLNCEELRSKQSKSKQAISMYLASKMCSNPRPFKDICRMYGVDDKTVRKLHSEVFRLISSKKLNLAKHRKANLHNSRYDRNNIHNKKQSTIEVYALRYASKLQCDKKQINKLLTSIVRNVETKFDFASTRQPTSIAAACVYFASMMNADKKQQRTYKEVSAVSGVSQNTLQDIYRRQLHPNRIKLIPNFADQLRAQQLPLR